MGTSQQHKAQSRQAIVEAAGHLFRDHGVDGVSVAEIMDAAGLTHGGFPRHFASKQELVGEALVEAIKSSAGSDRAGAANLKDFARSYLTVEHRDNRADGCVYAALGSELTRAPAETRRLISARIEKQIEALSGEGEAGATEAIGTWSAMIGAMILARIVEDEALSEKILKAAREFVGVGDEKQA